MTTLTEFLLACIAEDEAEARYADEAERNWHYGSFARVLAECEAKRRIIALHDNRCPACFAGRRCVAHDVSAGTPSVRYRDPVDLLTLQALALPYADRPGFREEWRP